MMRLFTRSIKRIVKPVYQRAPWLFPDFVVTLARTILSSSPKGPIPLPIQWSRSAVSFPTDPPIQVGFIGAGQYAEHHLKVLQALEGVSVTRILTTGGPNVDRIAPLYNIAEKFTDIEEFLSSADVHCYVVVASAHMVKDLAGRCLETGRPVLMEKPAGLSAEDTEWLVQRAEDHKTFGMVGMNRRFYSVLDHGLAALADCGPLRGASLDVPEAITRARQLANRTELEYERWMYRNSIHGLDLLRYVLGDVSGIHSVARPNQDTGNAAASFAAVLEHDSGAVSTVLALWDTPSVFRLRLVAESGTLELAPLEQGIFTDSRGRRFPVVADRIDVDFRTGLFEQDRTFIHAVRSGTPPGLPACLLPDALASNRLIKGILANTAG